MLEKADLSKKLSKKHYRRIVPRLQYRLADLQKACWETGTPTVVVFQGWDASGKGAAIATLTARLDPRAFRLHSIEPPAPHEQDYPWLRRFWLMLPAYGQMAIFDKSWYTRVLVERVEKLAPKREWRRAYREIADFERMLVDDGVVLVKFFFHISKKEQKRRFDILKADPLNAWRVEPGHWHRYRSYDKYLVAVEEMLERTESEWAPWTVVEATSRRYASKKVLDVLIARLEEALGQSIPASEEVADA